MGDWNPFMLDEFEWDVLTTYIKHGWGNLKLYNTTFFSCQLTDETACMTLDDFSKKAIDYNGEIWVNKIQRQEYGKRNY